MSEKPKPAPKSWRGKPHVDMEYGKMAPVRYPDTPSKKLGGWLAGMLMPWKR